MGIPKFFRFISERWPLISQLVDEKQVPEFDNLYLDMNSILHTCTHSNDPTITRLSDEQVYASIFNYIEHLFQIIKPKKTFYMAIDGVAPRAKMNQQRARRFRTAFEAEQILKKAIENGEEIPKEDPFDSNAITPGTEFMYNLTNKLKYFIHKKVSTDSSWSPINVILSGHEVPGEGEHKIMEYIRAIRSQDDYDSNLRHCIYGLDADLIMLGLVSHDPHFALLREEVTFGNKKSSPTNLNDQNFFLLHLSLLREYLALEFQEIESQINFEFNFERILDDFILIMYVIGNDFLPNLPDLHINKGAFPLLIATFKQTLLQSDGYINEDGKINLKRLYIWFKYLSHFEFENFEKQEVDVEWFNKKLDDISISGEKKRKKIGKLLILKEQKKLVGYIKPWLLEVASQPVDKIIALENEGKLSTLKLNKEDVEKNLDFIKEFALEAGFLIIHSKQEDSYTTKYDVDGLASVESTDEFDERLNELRKTIKEYQSANLVESEEVLQETKEVYSEKFKHWKNEYYESKVHFPITDEFQLTEMAKHYVEGLQWVLYYYYKGCPSWNWYYKHHYAPRISDISLGIEALLKEETDIKFDLSHPFKPFEQLMAVLPARSKKLMPAVYWPLMTDEKSPIIKFYPNEVDIDLNGKTASWEAVVLLDFVDERKLLEALKPIESKLSKEETERNSYGVALKFYKNANIKSPNDDFCHHTEFVLPAFHAEKTGFIQGAKTGIDLHAGFPSLYSIPFTSELLQNEIKIFNFPSRSESMILQIENTWADLSTHQFAQRFMNKIVYGNWPYLREYKIVKIMDEEAKYEFRNNNLSISELSQDDKKSFRSDSLTSKLNYDKVKGVKLEEVSTLVYATAVNGLIRNSNGAYVKTFAKETEIFPLQLIVKDVINKDQRFATRPPLSIEEEFPINSQVVFLGDFGYGAPAKVVGYNKNKLAIKIFKIQSTQEPNIGKKRLAIENREIKYYPSFEVAKTLRISPLLLSKITSQYIITNEKNQKVNIGLELKFESKRQKVLGYTKKSLNGKFWEFSPLAINLLQQYISKFPNLFRRLNQLGPSDIPNISQVSIPDECKKVREWLKEVKSELIPVSLESESFTKFSYQAIEQYMNNYILNQVPTINKDIKGVPREAILNASESYQLLGDQKFELGDRVIYVQDFGKVPILTKGTVVSISTLGSKTSLGVIFDVALLSGSTFNGKLTSNRGLMIDSSLVLNLSNKQFVYHSKASQVRKPMTYDEKIAKLKANEQRKKEMEIKKTEEDQKNKFIENKKGSNELLSLLKKKSDKKEDEQKNEEKKEEDDKKSNTRVSNPHAIKSVYNQIYQDVMNDGQIPQYPPVQMLPYGVPLPHNVPAQAHGYYPPPQYYPQQQIPPHQQAIPQQQPNLPESRSIPYYSNDNEQQSSENNVKRGGHGYRGRGNPRGGFRGRGGHYNNTSNGHHGHGTKKILKRESNNEKNNEIS
ncbi:unnamed protein product [Candida verbasci]|uniref:5'-3' exoribonuclease 1 n=1 Tax=Candida verbasci TaxID=1227364 RepID=A0A9W4XFW4_9ASCO|nr:unnamed protein product [Candida verbasci]